MKEQVLCSELPSGWTLGAQTENDLALLFVLEQSEEGYDHFVVVKALKVFADGQWEVYELGQVATKATTLALEGLPTVMSPENISAAIQHLADLEICCGNGDEEFLELRQAQKDVFVDKKVANTNYVDKQVYFKTASALKGTIRHIQCARLAEKAPHSQTTRCTQCTIY